MFCRNTVVHPVHYLVLNNKQINKQTNKMNNKNGKIQKSPRSIFIKKKNKQKRLRSSRTVGNATTLFHYGWTLEAREAESGLSFKNTTKKNEKMHT